MKRSEMIQKLKEVLWYADRESNNKNEALNSSFTYTLAELALQTVEEFGMEYIDNNYNYGWKPEKIKKSK